jgi:hypothetical protein
MVDAPESPAPAPPRGSLSTLLSIDGGRSQISSSGTSQGPHRRRFLVLIVGLGASIGTLQTGYHYI